MRRVFGVAARRAEEAAEQAADNCGLLYRRGRGRRQVLEERLRHTRRVRPSERL
ncbi:hypothetical protein [Streptomyces sp. AC555_RSS877]|uniref:hypothetical protein n=1 Tax=Streptomyces sp. AC555_RSS877 TaxID=2823688 RepID=UPI001C275117|nr:hypothetical protein [Streptomyces sp. AC555_RSS877]